MIGVIRRPVCPGLYAGLRDDRTVANRENDGMGPRLRISAWLPPGLALGWLAILATFVQGVTTLLTTWAATLSLVVLLVRGFPRVSRGGPSDAAGGHTSSVAMQSAARPSQGEGGGWIAQSSGVAEKAATSTARSTDSISGLPPGSKLFQAILRQSNPTSGQHSRRIIKSDQAQQKLL